MVTVVSNNRRPQPADESELTPFDVFQEAIDRHQIWLDVNCEEDAIEGEISDAMVWRRILEATGAHPDLVVGVVLETDDGSEIRLRRV